MKRNIVTAAVLLFSVSYPGIAQKTGKAGIVISNSKEIIIEYTDPAKPSAVGEKLNIPDSRGSYTVEVTSVSDRHAKCRVLSGTGIEQSTVVKGSAAYYGAGSVSAKNEVKTVGGIEFVLVKGGSFEMGVNYSTEKNYYLRENVKHTVNVSSFWISRYEVSQAQYSAVMRSNPSSVKGDSLPVDTVSWHDASSFCAAFNKRNRAKVRIPYEAEWEYAARAGSTSVYFWGNDINGDYCWYAENSGDASHPVGQKIPNAFGLYDMSGNVCEWVADWYDENYYKISQMSNPHGPETGTKKILRGGSYVNMAMHPSPMRVDIRIVDEPDKKSEGWGAFGMRLVLPEQ